ncbi:hypothetical protein MAM1_0215c08138 [Mucor ambiguus]|uniref:Zinc-finger domain-containing protein n=1 Tax=Mucor ambiguus TaxID=91626 RepID=A0A0C9N1Z4_9FUNG|nr:hypothetical protein MAM1_0215c08138 [Mucor ambiguus]
MVKASQKNEVATKPKFQQTRLCFAPVSSPSTISMKKDNYAEKLEQEILDLKITIDQEPNEHEDICKGCDISRPRIHCTALKQDSTEPCAYSFCDACVKKWANEDMEWIKSNDTDFVYRNGDTTQHRPGLSGFKWACLVCRGLCKCRYCSKQSVVPKKKGSKLLFNMAPVKPIDPPELQQLEMLYSEEEIWIRLQIREFIFRFGELYGLDDRVLSNLQNVQGDWKIKKLGAYLVYHCLFIMSQSTEYDAPLSPLTEETIPQKAKSILNGWFKEKKLTTYYLDNQSRNQALMDILTTEGMTCRRWQDVAELLALAEHEDIPIPTLPPLKKPKLENEDDEEYDVMDIDQEEELLREIERYRKPVRNTALLPAQTELKLVCMLLELLLYHTQIRQSLSVPNHGGSASRGVREMALELKKYIKEYNVEATQKKSKQYKLTTRINQLMAVRGKKEELKNAQIELDELETLIRDERIDLETKKIQLNVASAKSQKRMEPAGVDMLGNQYWIFNDLLDHLNHASDYRNSEQCWAYGIVIIGPGLIHSEEHDIQWWYIKGIENMKHLVKWIQQQTDEKDTGDLAKKIKERIDHLTALECVVYGEGFFAV